MSNPHMDVLSRLTRHRWMVRLIAAIADTDGARFVELLHRLAISRESLSRTIDHGIAAGWVMRNGGHGHPLRPEYLLTDAGAGVADLCIDVCEAQDALSCAPDSVPRWGLPLIGAIGGGAQRFSAMARTIPQSNPRALSQSLKLLTIDALVARRIAATYPPLPLYDLTARGQRLAAALNM